MESLSRTKPLAHRTSSSRSKRLSSARSDGRSSHLVGRASLPTRVEADDAGSYARLGFDFSGLAVLERLFLRMPAKEANSEMKSVRSRAASHSAMASQ